LVAAARSRGHHPPVERSLAATERELRELSVEAVDTEPARKRLAEAGTEVERLREAVATARGRLQSRREMGADTTEAESALADATRELSTAETERVAAEQAHDAVQRRAREAREARQRRLRLQDRVANRRRDTRRALANAVADAFAAAVEAVPGDASLSTEPLEIRGDGVTAGLAAARIAELRGPVVDETGRFDSATAAAEALEAPIVRL
jgi:chromosome segregation ATPase